MIELMGLGGSGKTTIAKKFKNYKHFYNESVQTRIVKLNIPFKKNFRIFLPILAVIESHIFYRKNNKDVLDRSPLDKFIQYDIYKYAPRWFLELLFIFIKKPFFVVILDISPEESYKRKKEHNIEFIKNEKKVMEYWLKKIKNKIYLDTNKLNIEETYDIIRRMVESEKKYYDPIAQLIIDKEEKIKTKKNFDYLFNYCLKNRVLFYYFYDELKEFYLPYEEKRKKIEIEIGKKYKIVKKLNIPDISGDIDVLGIKKDNKKYEIEIDFHKTPEYFGIKFDYKQWWYYHMKYETGTFLLKDLFHIPNFNEWDLFYKTQFPKFMKIKKMVEIAIKNKSIDLLLNYFRVFRAHIRGKIPYYNPNDTLKKAGIDLKKLKKELFKKLS